MIIITTNYLTLFLSNKEQRKRWNKLFAEKPEFSATTAFLAVLVQVSASRAEDPGFESRLCRDFSGVESYH